jgi:hypothetical protein
MNTSLNGLFSQFGAKGMPPFISEDFSSSWDAYDESGHLKETTPRERVISVLGFLHLMKQAGYKKTAVNPYKAYEDLLAEEFGQYAKTLAQELRKLRVFDLFRIYKTHFEVAPVLRGSRDIHLSFCVMPKRKEPLDNTLNKAEGYLYNRDLPIFLQERWKKMNIKSTSIKPRSALPKYFDLMKSPSVLGRLPLLINNNYSLHVSRSAGDMLVFRFKVAQPVEQVSWMSKHAHNQLLRKLWVASFKSLQG